MAAYVCVRELLIGIMQHAAAVVVVWTQLGPDTTMSRVALQTRLDIHTYMLYKSVTQLVSRR